VNIANSTQAIIRHSSMATKCTTSTPPARTRDGPRHPVYFYL
jgi:hypothetical protein